MDAYIVVHCNLNHHFYAQHSKLATQNNKFGSLSHDSSTLHKLADASLDKPATACDWELHNAEKLILRKSDLATPCHPWLQTRIAGFGR